MNIDYLYSDELEYELGIRGYRTGGNVANKRKLLRTALRLEKDGITFPEVSLLTPDKEIKVCNQKVVELKSC